MRYREPAGRSARQREKSFDRKKDAVDFATKVENDKRENTYIDPTAGKVSLRRYIEDWLSGSILSAGTWESYERIMRLHVLPHLGSKTVSQVTAADVESLLRAVDQGRGQAEHGRVPQYRDVRAVLTRRASQAHIQEPRKGSTQGRELRDSRRRAGSSQPRRNSGHRTGHRPSPGTRHMAHGLWRPAYR
ncbi:tyrosine-type recombinase/integrase [Streptomyces daliensis]